VELIKNKKNESEGEKSEERIRGLRKRLRIREK